jgi:hypothetical protein
VISDDLQIGIDEIPWIDKRQRYVLEMEEGVWRVQGIFHALVPELHTAVLCEEMQYLPVEWVCNLVEWV